MPAGDLISADWQAELRTTLMGNSTFPIVSVDISPPTLISHDLPKLLDDGEFQGSQYEGAQYVTLTMNVTGSSESNLISNLDTLKTAWAKASSDLTFVIRLPSWGKRSIQGRPAHALDVPQIESQQLTALLIRGVRAQFKAGDPTWTQL